MSRRPPGYYATRYALLIALFATATALTVATHIR